MVRILEGIRRTSSSHEPASKKQKSTVASSSAPRTNARQLGASQAQAPKTVRNASPQGFDNIRPDLDDRYGEQPRSAEEYAQVWTSYSNERNKENRPAPKRRLVDSQPGAREMRWVDSQETEVGPSTSKRKYQEPAEEENEEGGGEEVEQEEEQREEAAEEEDVSEDEGFQQDHRVADPARRLAAPKAQRQFPLRDALSPPKRQEHSRNDSDLEPARRRQQRAESGTRPSARREVVDEEEDEEEDAYPPPTFPQASVVARVNVARAQSRMSREPQKRIPWSEEDSIRLMDAIEQFGCSWSLIAKNVDFDHPRDQVALKDKARNMKVTYLK